MGPNLDVERYISCENDGVLLRSNEKILFWRISITGRKKNVQTKYKSYKAMKVQWNWIKFLKEEKLNQVLRNKKLLHHNFSRDTNFGILAHMCICQFWVVYFEMIRH